jgi:hypothetical protein
MPISFSILHEIASAEAGGTQWVPGLNMMNLNGSYSLERRLDET